MAGMKGMDVDAVQKLGQQMQNKSDDIKTIVNQIQSLVGGAQWVGPDADRFRNDWESNLKNQLNNTADALHGAGQSALNNATEQAGVSDR
jgi:hypothetical protein